MVENKVKIIFSFEIIAVLCFDSLLKLNDRHAKHVIYTNNFRFELNRRRIDVRKQQNTNANMWIKRMQWSNGENRTHDSDAENISSIFDGEAFDGQERR